MHERSNALISFALMSAAALLTLTRWHRRTDRLSETAGAKVTVSVSSDSRLAPQGFLFFRI